MFARKVSVRLRPDALKEFTKLIKSQILPWLQAQEGFLDLVILAVSDGTEVQALSFWEQEGHALADNCSGYPAGILTKLESLLNGGAHGKTFDVVCSTLERFAPKRPQESGSADLELDQVGSPDRSAAGPESTGSRAVWQEPFFSPD